METINKITLDEIIKTAEICPFCGSENTSDPKLSGMGAPNKKCNDCGETWNTLHMKHSFVTFKHYF